VRVSFDIAEYTANITGLGTTRILEAIRRSKKSIKFYQASSSEMFGSAKPPQNENTVFEPRSPYACAKLYSYWMARNYREGFNLHISNGILFNHESPRRGENFVTRKVTMGVASIIAGKMKHLYMGNLNAKRDWGFTPEYVEAMHSILKQKKSDDYVIATGETHTVKEFIEEAFKYAGMDWKKYVKIDKRYYRATEVDVLLGDNRKAKKLLKWTPKVTFKDLVKIMLDADMRKNGLPSIGEGDAIIKKKFNNKWWSGD
jgi:GDPmannose 4,6-dehydratase